MSNMFEVIPPNSNKAKEEAMVEQKAEVVESKHTKNIANGKLVKKSVFGRIIDGLISDDAGDVGDYILTEKIIPWISDLIVETIYTSAQVIFRGKKNVTSSRSFGPGRGGFNYNRVSSNSIFGRDPRDRDRDDNSLYLPRRDYKNIMLDNIAQAKDVIEELADIIEQDDSVSLLQLYDICGVKPESTDSNYGWYSIKGFDYMPCTNGCILKVPKPVLLRN